MKIFISLENRFSDNFRALTQMLSRKALLPLVAFLSAKAFPAKIARKGENKTVLTACFFALAFFLFGSRTEAQSCIGDSAKIEWLLYENLSGGNIQRMFASPKFPQNPDYIENLNNLTTPGSSYNDYYGSMIRGFLKAPETGDYVFNLTGDDDCLFYLSPDSTSVLLTQRAYIDGWTGPEEHGKYTSQTSDTVQLTAGEYYFFKLLHREGGGGDHLQLYWKTPSNLNSPGWTIVTGEHVYATNCDNLCLDAGTPCDDGDPLTENDQWDGNCGCSGTPATLPYPCIGERGGLLALYYDSIDGYWVQAMYDAPDYPLAPHRAEILSQFNGPLTGGYDKYGTRIRGYLRAPATGKYIFNVTGANEVRLMLKDGETTTLADEIAFNDGWTSDYEHWKTPEQTSDSIDLVAGQFYAIEMVHKDDSSNDDFAVFWKTPVSRDTFWQIIGGSFLYQYGCEVACMPQGTPCDDGDPMTFADQYDNNCNCTGTPCSDPQCSNALNYTVYEACDENTGNHSTNPNSSWLSCEPSPSPNPERGVSHWIQYDFGAIYALSSADIWNYNVAGASAQGFNQVVIDYSLDGVNWSELGTFNWEQATGTSSYGGFTMTELSGISAHFVLITSLSNFEGSGCMGLSEVSFNAVTCPNEGTLCDDGDPYTEGDAYNEFCYCTGTSVINTDCDSVSMISNERPLASGSYNAELTIQSAALVEAGSNVSYVAGESITLTPGFKVESGADFHAYIFPCNPISQAENQENMAMEQAKTDPARNEDFLSKVNEEAYSPDKVWLRIAPNPTSIAATIEFNLPISSKIRLGIYKPSGELVTWLANGQFYEQGIHQKTMNVQHLPSSIYAVSLFTGNGVMTKRLVVE